MNVEATLWAMAISYTVMFAYSIYMAWLNHKQAKVTDKIELTNKLLKDILKEVKK